MTEPLDIRWKQRFQNYTKALSRLADAVELATTRDLTTLEEQGLIQAFEFTHELAWKTLQDYLKHQGAAQNITGSRDATRIAVTENLIHNGDIWMSMIESRNKSSHTYNEDTAEEISTHVKSAYYAEFEQLKTRLTQAL